MEKLKEREMCKLLIRKMTEKDIDICAEISVETYAKDPWNEIYNPDKVKAFLSKFITNDNYKGWVITKGEEIAGFAVGIIIPSIGIDYFRIEDICVRSNLQSQGIGGKLLRGISSHLKSQDFDAIMLNTVKEFPSYDFYIKNGFTEIEYSTTMILTLR